VAASFIPEPHTQRPRLRVKPTTRAGVVALLKYAIEADTDRQGFPDLLVSDDGKIQCGWQFFLINRIGTALAEVELSS